VPVLYVCRFPDCSSELCYPCMLRWRDFPKEFSSTNLATTRRHFQPWPVRCDARSIRHARCQCSAQSGGNICRWQAVALERAHSCIQGSAVALQMNPLGAPDAQSARSTNLGFSRSRQRIKRCCAAALCCCSHALPHMLAVLDEHKQFARTRHRVRVDRAFKLDTSAAGKLGAAQLVPIVERLDDAAASQPQTSSPPWQLQSREQRDSADHRCGTAAGNAEATLRVLNEHQALAQQLHFRMTWVQFGRPCRRT